MPTLRGLLIGINQYRVVTTLQGCVADVQAMRAVLLDRFAADPANLELLLDEAATRQGIFEAWARLVARTQPGDPVLVHYSGHGSFKTVDRSIDPKGRIETIVPVDGRTTNVLDITDKELNGLIQTLGQKTGNITLVFDCCHSGSITRDPAIPPGVRLVAGDLRAYPPTVLQPLTGTMPPSVTFAACADNQLANEYPSPRIPSAAPSSQRSGALSYFLTRALRAAPAGSTYQSVFQQARSELRAAIASPQAQPYYLPQDPLLEGDGNRVLFGSVVQPQPRTITVLDVTDAGVLLDAGIAHGLGVGSTLVVPPAIPNAPPAHLTVTAADPCTAQARTDNGVTVTRGSQAQIESASGLPKGRMPVRVCVNAQRQASLSDAVQYASYLITLAQTSSDPILIVDLIETSQGNLVLQPAQGRSFVLGASKDWDNNTITDALAALARWRNLAAAGNRDPSTALTNKVCLKVQRVTQTESAVSDSGAELPRVAGGYQAASGARLLFTLTNQSDRALFVALFRLGYDGSIRQLYSFPGGGEMLGAGDTVNVGTGSVAGDPPIFAASSADGQPVQELFKLIAVTERTQFDRTLQGPIVTPRTPTRSADTRVQLLDLLRKTFGLGSATRDMRLISSLEPDWTTDQLIVDS